MDSIVKNLPWDLKNAVNKVKNAVLNYTEMESKVREATNNDAWGASSTLLLEISRATYNYQHFNEIMPMIYKRFQESQKNWRQIYKTLQLVEYLLKNGSERVLDNVKDHVYDIRSLSSYQFVDEKGKDQGINVRHRAKEILDLMDDPDRLKSEREKATTNRNKYSGVSSEEVKYGGSIGGSNSYSSSSSSSTAQSNSAAVPSIKMISDPTPVVNVTLTTAKSQPTEKKEVNLLDIDFSAPAPPVATVGFTNNSSNEWGDFSSVTSQPVAPAPKNSFASFSQPPVVQQHSFAGFNSQPQAVTPFTQQNSFGGFSQASQSSEWANFTSAPAPVITPVPAPVQAASTTTQRVSGNFTIQSKTAGDVWNSNLVSLDSLGKFEPPKQTTGPPLSSLPSTNRQPQTPTSTNATQGWGNFSNANYNSNNTQNNNDLLL